MLTFAGTLARQQRGGDRLRCGNRGQLVGQDRAEQPWAHLVGTRLHRRKPRKALDHRVVGRFFGIWAILAKAAARDIDDLWRGGAHRLLPDPETVGNAGTEVLDENIGSSGKPQ